MTRDFGGDDLVYPKTLLAQRRPPSDDAHKEQHRQAQNTDASGNRKSQGFSQGWRPHDLKFGTIVLYSTVEEMFSELRHPPEKRRRNTVKHPTFVWADRSSRTFASVALRHRFGLLRDPVGESTSSAGPRDPRRICANRGRRRRFMVFALVEARLIRGPTSLRDCSNLRVSRFGYRRAGPAG